jgi:hypothetical protein
MSQPIRGLLAQSFSHYKNEVGPPRMMMTSAALPAVRGLAQFVFWAIIRGHDVGQLVKAGQFASVDARSVVCADLYPALVRVSMTVSPAAHDGHQVRVRRKGAPEPSRLLDGINVDRAKPIIYSLVTLDEYRAGKLADRQARRELGVICRLLQVGRLYPSRLASVFPVWVPGSRSRAPPPGCGRDDQYRGAEPVAIIGRSPGSDAPEPWADLSSGVTRAEVRLLPGLEVISGPGLRQDSVPRSMTGASSHGN